MTTLANFANPISVIQRSPTSGVFGSNLFVGDKEGFVQKVIGKWYCTPGNTIPVESMSHLEQAEKLYDFYVKYLQVKEKTSVNLGLVLHKLYSTGSIQEAEIALEAIKTQAGVTA